MPRFAVFYAGEKRLAVEVSRVAAFVRQLLWTPVPPVKPGLIGVCNWRGEICPLVEPGALLGFTGAQGPWACIVQTPKGKIAVLADQVSGLEQATATPIEEMGFSGTYQINGETRFVLSCEELAKACTVAPEASKEAGG